jgi:hypothetical protein
MPLRQLSGQSSFGVDNPSVPEETTDLDDMQDLPNPVASDTSSSSTTTANKKLRPDSLILRTNLNLADTMDQQQLEAIKTRNYLSRSQSTKQFDKSKKAKAKQMSNEFDQIYTLSSYSDHRTSDDNYDSIEVIHERRVKNFSKFNSDSCGSAGGVIASPPPENPQSDHVVVTIDIENSKVVDDANGIGETKEL